MSRFVRNVQNGFSGYKLSILNKHREQWAIEDGDFNHLA